MDDADRAWIATWPAEAMHDELGGIGSHSRQAKRQIASEAHERQRALEAAQRLAELADITLLNAQLCAVTGHRDRSRELALEAVNLVADARLYRRRAIPEAAA